MNIRTLQKYILEQDYNRMTAMREFTPHQGRVTGVVYAVNNAWILSIGRDKFFHLYCTNANKIIGSYQTDTWLTALQYPFKTILFLRVFIYFLNLQIRLYIADQNCIENR